jgi:plasmid stabilization system protein ParE
MSYQVRILARARQDFEDYIAWIAGRSPQGAERWAAAFEAALARLEENPFLSPVASESEDIGEEVRNILFRTRAGRTYRALFVVVDDEVRILRIRGPGAPPVTRDDLNG